MKLWFASQRNRRQEESLTWLARLQRGLREREGPDLLDWLQRSGNRSYIARAAVEWSAPEVIAVLSEIFPIDRFLKKPARRRSPVVGIIAIFVATGVIITPFVFVNRTLISMSRSYTTSPSAGRRIQLEDGTSVMLNAATRIVVGFSNRLRFVNVLDGEAYFAVMPDSHRPFRARVGGRDLVANATVFDVRVLAPQSAVLTVLTGTAVVSPADVHTRGPTTATQNHDPKILVDTVVGPFEALQFGPDVQSTRKISGREAQARLGWQRGLPPAKSRRAWWPLAL